MVVFNAMDNVMQAFAQLSDGSIVLASKYEAGDQGVAIAVWEELKI